MCPQPEDRYWLAPEWARALEMALAQAPAADWAWGLALELDLVQAPAADLDLDLDLAPELALAPAAQAWASVLALAPAEAHWSLLKCSRLPWQQKDSQLESAARWHPEPAQKQCL